MTHTARIQIHGQSRLCTRCARCEPGYSVVVEADTYAQRGFSANAVTDLHKLHTTISFHLPFSSCSAQQRATYVLAIARTVAIIVTELPLERHATRVSVLEGAARHPIGQVRNGI